MPEREQPSELARELLIGAAIAALAIAALCVVAATPPRRRRFVDGGRTAEELRDELTRARRATDELAAGFAKTERELAVEVEEACEVALVAIQVGEAGRDLYEQERREREKLEAEPTSTVHVRKPAELHPGRLPERQAPDEPA